MPNPLTLTTIPTNAAGIWNSPMETGEILMLVFGIIDIIILVVWTVNVIINRTIRGWMWFWLVVFFIFAIVVVIGGGLYVHGEQLLAHTFATAPVSPPGGNG